MPWITAGAALGGALISANAAGDAADQQSRATDLATQEQRRQFDLTRADQLPFLQTGQSASLKLRDLLGLGGGSSGQSLDQIISGLRASGRFNVSGGPSGGTTGSIADILRDPSKRAAFASWMNGEASAPVAAAPTYDEAALMAEAQRLYGAQGSSNDPSYGSLLKTFTPGDLTNDPGYKFGLNQGNTSIENAARARGMYMSPSTVKELLRYNQDYAGTKYNDAFNRDLTNRTTTYNMLSGTSGGGQTAANTLATTGANTAGTIGNLVTSGANARGAAGIAGANAISGAFGNIANTYNQKSILDRILAQGSGGFNPWANGGSVWAGAT